MTNIQRILNNALNDLSILAGETVGLSGAAWQDVAGTASANLKALAMLIDDRRKGGAFPDFPSVEEAIAQINA